MSTTTTKTTTRTIVLGKFNFCTEMPLRMNYIADEQWQSTERMKDLEGQQRTKSVKRTQVYVDISKLVQSSKRLI